jgi:hypothetical protein
MVTRIKLSVAAQIASGPAARIEGCPGAVPIPGFAP